MDLLCLGSMYHVLSHLCITKQITMKNGWEKNDKKFEEKFILNQECIDDDDIVIVYFRRWK